MFGNISDLVMDMPRYRTNPFVWLVEKNINPLIEWVYCL